MKSSELMDSSVEELRKKEQEMRKELFNLRFQQATGEIENPMRIRTVRKDIARILTVITAKNKKAS
jgi:large subunit ribosomal protein L29